MSVPEQPPPPPPPETRSITDPENPHRHIPRHAVRADGIVYYLDTRWCSWKALKTKTGPYRHLKVAIRDGDRIREVGVAALVLRAFVGPRPLGHVAFHWPDTDPRNCRLENLRWAPEGTSKIGRLCSGSPPKPKRGEAHPHARLTADLVREIRRLYRDSWPYREIADEIGVNGETIRNVLLGRTWSHVPDPLGPIVMRPQGAAPGDAPTTLLDWEAVAEIRAAYAAGKGSYRTLAHQFGVSRITIRDIVKGRTWRVAAGG